MIHARLLFAWSCQLPEHWLLQISSCPVCHCSFTMSCHVLAWTLCPWATPLQNHADEEGMAEQMAAYVDDLLEDVLKETTCKPHGKTLALKPLAHACVALRDAAGSDAPAPLGAWLRRAMCLVPLQVSRCNGNTLEPMHDGEPRCDAADDGDDIVELSKQLRWGLYESIIDNRILISQWAT
jgi:hypothetical protein